MTAKLVKADESKLLYLIKNHYAKVSILSYLIAFVLFALLISEYLCDKTYFSDNALLPGFVKREFNSQHVTDNLKSLRSFENRSPNSAATSMPVKWLVDKFQGLALQVHTQQFEFSYPFNEQQQNQTGTNVYAIFKATRSLGTEALVLSTPFRSHSKSTLPGIALLIALAEYFSQQNYWSKDLIFLIYEHNLVGCEAWLNAYYNLNDENSFIKFEQLEDRSGIIQAAINLDISAESTPNLDIQIEGLNGQLTNLDLFNVVVEIASRESIDATFHQYSHFFSPDLVEVWLEYAKTIGSMISTQASTFTNGAHGLFQKRSIQSLTIVAEEEPEDMDYLKADLIQIGKVLEGVFRSCNNMIERFNRSYWFYLLPSTRRYISIGFYMIPFALIILPALLKALVVYLNAIEAHSSVIDAFWIVLPQIVWIHLYGIAIASFPFMIQNSSKLQTHFNFKSEELLFYSLLSFMCSLTFNPILNDVQSKDELVSDKDELVSDKDENKELKKSNFRSKIISIQKYVALLNLALVLVCLSLINISLALVLSSIYIPLMCTITGLRPANNLQKLSNYLHKLLLILANPLMLIYLVELTKSIYTEPNRSLFVHLNSSFIAQKQYLLSLVEDWYLFGNWTYLIGSVTLFPLWLQFWYLLNS